MKASIQQYRDQSQKVREKKVTTKKRREREKKID